MNKKDYNNFFIECFQIKTLMNLPELIKAELNLKDGSKLNLVSPKLKVIKGVIYLKGMIDHTQLNSLYDLKNKLQEKRIQTNEDFISLSALTSSNTEVFISNLSYSNINYTSLKVKLICYGEITENLYKYPNNEVNSLKFISVEGLTIAHENFTHTESKRVILNKTQILTKKSKKDYSEYKLSFIHLEEQIDLNLSFIQCPNSNNTTNIIIEGENGLSLDIYNIIKTKFRAFLSFPAENNVVFREEKLIENSELIRKIYSTKKRSKKKQSNYILIDAYSSMNNSFEEYLKCFDAFLVLDKYFDLTNVIYLFNDAKKGSLESRIFIMLIIMEKLADRFLDSPFNTNPNSSIIDQTLFNSLIINTKKAFNDDFKNLSKKEFNQLKSVFGNLNRKTNTDKKIDDFIEFVEIKRTEDINKLFPKIRNLVIHTGEVNHPEANAFVNYKTLYKLLNDIIANLIQYKGFRLLECQENKNIVEEKKLYKLNIQDYR